MGLFNFLKKKDKALDSPIDDNPFAETINTNKEKNMPTPNFQPQKVKSEVISDNSIKNAVKPTEESKKTEFDLDQVKKDKEYLDDVVKNDLDLNSKEIDFAIEKKMPNQKEGTTKQEEYDVKDPVIEEPKAEDFQETNIHPELKKKIDAHNEEIHISDEPITNESNVFESPSEKNVNNLTFTDNLDELESPDDIEEIEESLELPDFNKTPDPITLAREELKKLRKRKEIEGDLYVKATIYREVLHSNIQLKEDIIMCDNRLKELGNIKTSQSKQRDKLKETLESIQENLMFIEQKLFN